MFLLFPEQFLLVKLFGQEPSRSPESWYWLYWWVQGIDSWVVKLTTM